LQALNSFASHTDSHSSAFTALIRRSTCLFAWDESTGPFLKASLDRPPAIAASRMGLKTSSLLDYVSSEAAEPEITSA